MTMQETIVPVDAEVCAIGTWSTSQAGLIQMLGTRELLTVYSGGADGAVARLLRTIRRSLIGGTISAVAALGLIAWRFLAG
jgi:hypothetical protein